MTNMQPSQGQQQMFQLSGQEYVIFPNNSNHVQNVGYLNSKQPQRQLVEQQIQATGGTTRMHGRAPLHDQGTVNKQVQYVRASPYIRHESPMTNGLEARAAAVMGTSPQLPPNMRPGLVHNSSAHLTPNHTAPHNSANTPPQAQHRHVTPRMQAIARPSVPRQTTPRPVTNNSATTEGHQRSFMISNSLRNSLRVCQRYIVQNMECYWNGTQFIALELLTFEERRGLLPTTAIPIPDSELLCRSDQAQTPRNTTPRATTPQATTPRAPTPQSQQPGAATPRLPFTVTSTTPQAVKRTIVPAKGTVRAGGTVLPRTVTVAPEVELAQLATDPVASMDSSDASQTGAEATEPHKLLEGPENELKFVLCPNCGNSGKNLTICEGCKKKLPANVKIYTKNISGSQNNSPAKPRVKKNSEPVTVTILDSDDEVSDSSPSRPPKAARLEPDAQPRKRDLMRNKDGQLSSGVAVSGSRLLKSGRAKMKRTGPTDESASNTSAVASAKLEALQLEAKSVWLGNLKLWPQRHLDLSMRGLRMELRGKTEDYPMLHLSPREVEAVFLCEAPCCAFLYTTPESAARFRGMCEITRDSPYFFDPNSSETEHKRLTLVFKRLSSDGFILLKQHMESTLCRRRAVRSGPGRAAVYVVDKGLASSLMAVSAHADAADLKDCSSDLAHDVVREQVKKLEDSLHIGKWEEEACQEPVRNLFIYPFPPSTGGITVTNHDLWCLRDAEFLNDVIIDFYLRYILLEQLTEEQRERVHLFSSFFYKRMTHRPNRRAAAADDEANMSPQQRRHFRVKKWTRNVNLFQKDFVIVPINESSHWYLAIICFPGLCKPVLEVRPQKVSEEMADDTEPPVAAAQRTNSEVNSSGDSGMEVETSTEGQESSSPTAGSGDQAAGDGQETTDQTSAPTVMASPSGRETPEDQIDRAEVGGEGEAEEEARGVPDAVGASQVVLRQACILVLDSLAAPQSHCAVIRTLREYLEKEWKSKELEPTNRVFNKQTFKGCAPKVPQQTNFSDCGLYLLQYVESFFSHPPTEFRIPMPSMLNWFKDEVVAGKRSELRELICAKEREYEASVSQQTKR